MDNLLFYATGANPPAEACRSFRSESGFSGTDINAMWRIKILTEMFGPAGIGWYTEASFREDKETYGEHEDRVFCDLKLYVRNPDSGKWSMPITGTGGNKMWSWKWKDQQHSERVYLPNDDCYKMAETDAFGAACKKLGIGAKVYWDQDKSKYSINEDGEVEVHVPTADEIKAENRANKAAQATTFIPTKAERAAQAAQEVQSGQYTLPDSRTILKKLVAYRNTNPDSQDLAEYCKDNQWGDSFGKWSEDERAKCFIWLLSRGAEL